MEVGILELGSSETSPSKPSLLSGASNAFQARKLQNVAVHNKEGKNGDSLNMDSLGESDHATIAARILAASLPVVYQHSICTMIEFDTDPFPTRTTN